MGQVAIRAEHVCIDYREIQSMNVRQLLTRKEKRKEDMVFHAITDVSFTVEKGKILGILGQNGCGKSTLLRAIAGVFKPDSGTIDTYGYQVGLMAIGVGFEGNISGRENIICSGLLMGFSEKYILSKLNAIIEFSELGDFIDKPVRTYSSGMYSKLSFAITAILKTDIMLIDEVLSVGDEHFQKKSYSKMQELIMDDDKTVIIVSHNLETLGSLCDEVLWLKGGRLQMIGDPWEVIEKYREYMM